MQGCMTCVILNFILFNIDFMPNRAFCLFFKSLMYNVGSRVSIRVKAENKSYRHVCLVRCFLLPLLPDI